MCSQDLQKILPISSHLVAWFNFLSDSFATGDIITGVCFAGKDNPVDNLL
jgi:hypothetical protein